MSHRSQCHHVFPPCVNGSKGPPGLGRNVTHKMKSHHLKEFGLILYTERHIIYPSTLFFIEIHKLRVKANCPQKKKVVKQASQTQERITTLTTLAPTTGGLEASHFSLCKMDLFICVTWLHPCGILPGSRPGGWHNICHLH